jgi:hypothetical protein
VAHGSCLGCIITLSVFFNILICSGLHSEQQSAIKSQLDIIQNDAEKLSSASANDLKALRHDVVALLNSLKDKDCKDDSNSSHESVTGYEETQKLLFLSLDEIIGRLSKLEDALQVIPKETRVLQHLYFGAMFAREDSIDDASKGTFAWMTMTDLEFQEYLSSWKADPAVSAVENQSDDQRHDEKPGFQSQRAVTENMNESRQLLRKWLTHGEGVFHISGKAGSGKSTLMKFILTHTSTVECLNQWTNGKTLVLASYFFWSSDRQKLQMSLEGLFRSILFRVLRKCPYLIPDVFSGQWSAMPQQAGSMFLEEELFSPGRITEAFHKLMQKPVNSDKFAFCFFIDGLDEYEADAYAHRALAQNLRDWSMKSGIKMCVSSRPEVEFLSVFPKAQRINLHELTARDIRRSSQDMFENDTVFPQVQDIYLDLVDEIVKMAEGVFLWACLVVKSLIVEVVGDATNERLWQILHSTPRELDDVYDRMLNALSRGDRRYVDYILLLVVTNPFDTPMNAICLSWLYGPEDFRFPGSGSNYSDQDTVRQLERVRKQLLSFTKGLLDLAPDTSGLRACPMFSQRVQFFHRTARDYLSTPERKSQLDANFPLFDAHQIHSLLRLAELSLINPWNVPNSVALLLYVREVFCVREGANSPTQLSYAHMKILEEIWTYHFEKTMAMAKFSDAGFLSSIFYAPQRYGKESVRFLNVAVQHGQVDFVRQELLALDNRFAEAESRDSSNLGISASGQPDLLLTAACGTGGSEIVSLLLDRGFSAQSYVLLFDSSLYKPREVVTVWLAFIAVLSTVGFRKRRVTKYDLLSRLFRRLELLLTAADQESVVMLIRKVGDARTERITHFTTVEQLVLLCRPANMRELLRLLERWPKGDKAGRVKLSSRRIPATLANSLPIYQTADSLGQFEWEGVASAQEIITSLDNMAFRLW